MRPSPRTLDRIGIESVLPGCFDCSPLLVSSIPRKYVFSTSMARHGNVPIFPQSSYLHYTVSFNIVNVREPNSILCPCDKFLPASIRLLQWVDFEGVRGRCGRLTPPPPLQIQGLLL